jgi:hypothetical protein
VYSANAARRTYGRNTDKGEVGGSSPPRPTIQIPNKYAAILTFPLSGNISQKTDLPTICQLYDWPDSTTLRALRPFGEGQTASIDSAMSRTLPSQVEERARQCKTLQGRGTSGKSFLVSLRGVVQLVRTPACHARDRGFESRRSRHSNYLCLRPLTLESSLVRSHR